MASRMKHARTLALASAASGLVASFLLYGCEGSATQTTTGQGLRGTLVDIHGKPVPGAQVKAWPAAFSPNGLLNRPDSLAAFQAETDAEGRYSLPDLEAGVYNLYGENRQGDASVLIPRVKYLETALEMGTDTLAPSGTITGKVLYAGNPLTPVFCYLQGSTFVALTDSAGAFTLERIPAGTYRLNYVAQGYAPAADSPLVVLAGQTVSLASKHLVQDLQGQPPAPNILFAAYDSVEGTMRITWNRSLVSDWSGYHVESFRLGEDTLAPYTRRSLWDTVYTDSIGRWFGSGFAADADPLEPEEFIQVYRIRTYDREGNVSPWPANPIQVKVTRPEILKYSVSLRVAEGSIDTVLCQDSLVFILDLDQPSKGPVDAFWYMNSWRPTGTLATSIGIGRIHQNADTVVWKWDPQWNDEGDPAGKPDSVDFEVITRPAGSFSYGDARHLKMRVRPDGCYAVEKSRSPAVLKDKYGKYPQY